MQYLRQLSKLDDQTRDVASLLVFYGLCCYFKALV